MFNNCADRDQALFESFDLLYQQSTHLPQIVILFEICTLSLPPANGKGNLPQKARKHVETLSNSEVLRVVSAHCMLTTFNASCIGDGRNRAIVIAESLARVIAAI